MSDGLWAFNTDQLKELLRHFESIREESEDGLEYDIEFFLDNLVEIKMEIEL